MDIEKTKTIKTLISQLSALKSIIERTLSNSSMAEHSRYVSYKSMGRAYNEAAKIAIEKVGLDNVGFYPVDKWKHHCDLIWPVQKEIMEEVLVGTSMLLERIKGLTEFVEDEMDNFSNFIAKNLRATIYDIPSKEKEIQNAIETLLIGKGLSKGIDYDRETGKFNFSGKEYIPDFIIPKLNLCIEAKLLKEGRKSQIIEEINADITAYSKKYERQLFVVYDLGFIRDETEFRRDIENVADIKLVIVKH